MTSQIPVIELDAKCMLQQLADGRTEWIVDLLSGGIAANAKDKHGVSLLQHCAYYGDVTAVKLLVNAGEKPHNLGEDMGINGAAFHGHWRLCQYLLENGADPNYRSPETFETPLHAALSKTDRELYDKVLEVLLAHGAKPNVATKAGVETGAFMRDCRTKAESPLHRAAAFGNEHSIELLLQAGADVEAKDMNGDTPLSWASWYGRPTSVLRLLCYGNYRIHPDNRPMRSNLLGFPPTND